MVTASYVAALDIGNRSIKTVVVHKDPGDQDKINVLGYGIVPAKSVTRGAIDTEDEIKSIKKSVSMAERSAKTKIETAYIGISPTVMITTPMVVEIKKREVSRFNENDVNKVLEMAEKKFATWLTKSTKVKKFLGDQVILHVLARNFVIDKRNTVESPVGFTGRNLLVNAYIVTVPRVVLDSIRNCVNSVGIGVKEVVFEPIAAAESVLRERERKEGVLLLDIGCKTTQYAVFYKNGIIVSGVVGQGGWDFTSDLTKVFGIDFSTAEKIKCSYGDISGISTNDVIPIDEDTVLNVTEVNKVLVSRAEHLIGERIRKEIVEARKIGNYIGTGGVVITGGGSNLKGLTRFIRHSFGVPVRKASPIGIEGRNIMTPEWAVAVGLAKYGIKVEARKEGKGLFKWLGGKFGSWFDRYI